MNDQKVEEIMTTVSNEDITTRRRPRFSDDIRDLDLTDPATVRRFVTEQGKIIPARLTGVSSKQQRKIKQAVKIARNKNLL